ncbi:MAG: calcium/sodium antiporter [Elusimicrobiota bacterium]
MEHALHAFLERITAVHWSLLFGVIAAMLAVLAKSADLLVDEAVVLAERSNIPKVIIGATLVSLGTTTPEAAVSVFAALQGDPGLALGNAVGSVICDTGLILGLACILSPLPLERSVVNRQGWIQLGAGVLLVAASLPFSSRLPRAVGFIFLGLLVLYLWRSIAWARKAHVKAERTRAASAGGGSMAAVVAKLLGAVALVVASSHVLIPAVELAAKLIGVPEDVIAASLVAFGTSLPELVTALTAVRRGHGELAVGNVIGADILNVLFVAGAACVVTPGGLAVPGNFYRLHFPVMIAVLVLFRAGIFFSGDRLKRPFGVLLLGCYVAYLFLQYTFLGGLG